MDDKHALLEALSSDWLDVKAMPPSTDATVLWEIVFKTKCGDVHMAADAHTIPGGSDELFMLLLKPHLKKKTFGAKMHRAAQNVLQDICQKSGQHVPCNP